MNEVLNEYKLKRNIMNIRFINIIIINLIKFNYKINVNINIKFTIRIKLNRK